MTLREFHPRIVPSFIPLVTFTLLCSSCGSGNAKFSVPPKDINEWTWVSGSDTWNTSGVYGTEGVASASNVPGARELASAWTDDNRNFWLFGGNIAFTGVGVSALGNDLWKYDVTTGEWAWMGGSSAPNQPGVYGTESVSSSSNVPGAREAATGCTDSSGNFWLFGGIAYDSLGEYSADINDLWKYNPTNSTWTWVSGSNVNSLTTVSVGVYGMQGVPSVTNVPGARDGAAGWADSDGNLWVFGGYGYDSEGAFGPLNDLWKFNPTANTWTWMSGSNTVLATGSYGVQGVPAASNVPRARERVTAWIDPNGDLWLLGGIGWSQTAADMLNDLWKYDPASNMWTWVSGSATFDSPSVYGTEGVPAASNIPGGRERAIGWSERQGNFWLYGGEMYGGDELNDLWEYSQSTNMWTWVGGNTNPDQAGIYGMQGTPSTSNFPGSRTDAVAWTDAVGNLWLFGGEQQDTQGDGTLNDLWLYQP